MERENGTNDLCLIDKTFDPTEGGQWAEDFQTGSLVLEDEAAEVEIGFKFSNL